MNHAEETKIPHSIRAKIPRPATTMITVEVDSRTRGLVIDGWTIPAGKSKITIPQEELPRVMALVEDRAGLLARAQKHYEREVERAVKKENRAPETLPFSLSASFRKLAKEDSEVMDNDWDLRPLVSCKQVGEPFVRPADGQEDIRGLVSEIVRGLVKPLITEILGAQQGQNNNKRS